MPLEFNVTKRLSLHLTMEITSYCGQHGRGQPVLLVSPWHPYMTPTPKHLPYHNNMAEFLKRISTSTPTTPLDPPEQQIQDEHVREYLLHVDPESDISSPPPFTTDDVTELVLHHEQTLHWVQITSPPTSFVVEGGVT